MAVAVALANGGSGEPCSVAITSATRAEGKSITALWLASIEALSGRKVLVIDADHRAGTIAHKLGAQVKSAPIDKHVDRATVAQLVQHDSATGIYFISAGQLAKLAANQFSVQPLRSVLSELKHEYDLVILDTPPLLATADGLMYCNAADHTIFICRWQCTPRGAAHASLERLRAAGACLTGVVVSMIRADKEPLYSDTIGQRDQLLLSSYYSG